MKLLALVEGADHVCCRYRVRAFAPALAKAGWGLVIEPVAHAPWRRLAQFRRAGRYDAVLLQRKLLPAWQAALLRLHARRLVFDFDDAVLYRDSYDPRGPDCPRRQGRFRAIVRRADAVLAGNAFLAGCAREAGADPRKIVVLPTCVDSTKYEPKTISHGTSGTDLVWIGSSSTLQGLESQRALLESLGRSVPGLRLRVICDRFPRFEWLEVVATPWSEATEARDLTRGDIGISWVPDDRWSRGKCGLKLLQYRAAGLPVVTNPVGVHSEIVQHEVDGFLAGTTDAWASAVRRLVESAELRWRMGRAAREDLERRFDIAVHAPRFVTAISGFGHDVGRSPAAPAPHRSRSRATRASALSADGRRSMGDGAR